MIAAYTDYLTLSEAKNYLRIDSGVSEDDGFITSMISAALRWCEDYTNHIIVERDKTYYGNNDPWFCATQVYNVYDFPIVSVTEPSDPTLYTAKTFDTKTKYSTQAESIELNLGYDATTDVPDAFKQAALAILQVWYYNSEKTVNSTLIPDSVKFVLNPFRRFPLF